MKIVAIGDTHGNLAQLKTLIAKLETKVSLPDSMLVFLGDYVDGGPDTKGVIEYVRGLADVTGEIYYLKGNHEDMLLDAVCNNNKKYEDFMLWWTQGGMQTYMSYTTKRNFDRSYPPTPETIAAAIGQYHLAWMEQLPWKLETADFVFVHAGLSPRTPPHNTGEFEALWIRKEFIDSAYDWGKRVIYGHTYTKEPVVQKNKIGINTIHRSGGNLCAVVLEEGEPDAHEFVFALS